MTFFFFYGASFPASLSAAESEKIVTAATSEAVKCPCSAQLLSFIIPAPLQAACSLARLEGRIPMPKSWFLLHQLVTGELTSAQPSWLVFGESRYCFCRLLFFFFV